MDVTIATRDRHNLSLPATDRLILCTIHTHLRNKQSDNNAENLCAQASPGIFMNNRRTLSNAAGNPGPAILQSLFTPSKTNHMRCLSDMSS